MTDERATLLVCGPPTQAARLAAWGEQAGLRCIGQVTPETLAERLGRVVAVDLILIDLRGAGSNGCLDRGTARILATRHGLSGSRLAVLTDLAGLDCAIAWLDSPGTDFLCEPQDNEIAGMLALAALPNRDAERQPKLHDVAHENEGARLERLSTEVRRLAATIERLTQGNGVAGPSGSVREATIGYRANGHGHSAEPSPAERFRVREPRPVAPADSEQAINHGEIRALLRARRLREQFLPEELFADPAWDMILDLMAARLAGQRVSVSSLCIAAAVPPTTALRWIGQLTERGVFSRIDDPSDGRRVFIELTDSAAEAVNGWARAVRRNGGLLA